MRSRTPPPPGPIPPPPKPADVRGGMPVAPVHARDSAIASLCRTAERVLLAWAKNKGIDPDG